MTMFRRAHLSPEERQQLHSLRHKRPARHRVSAEPVAFGDRVADGLAALVGSWRFVIVQSAILFVWIAINVTGWIRGWDPYPFILLNLVLSFQAAYTAPIIMMSQNRQAEIDRLRAIKDYDVNLKAELEIELIHQKLDLLREQEIVRLTKLVEDLSARLGPQPG